MLRCTGNPQATKMTRDEFGKVWKELEAETPHWRAFWLLSSEPRKKYANIADFKALFKEILELHPGLNFLKDTP
jgi:hypothetical protein